MQHDIASYRSAARAVGSPNSRLVAGHIEQQILRVTSFAADYYVRETWLKNDFLLL
jgi:hypothetical protein